MSTAQTHLAELSLSITLVQSATLLERASKKPINMADESKQIVSK